MIDTNGSNPLPDHELLTAKNAEDHLAVFTLGGLTSSEEAELDKLIAEDPELALELQIFSDVTDSLAYLEKPVMPSEKTEEMLFKRVEANAQARFLISPSSTQVFKARIPQKKKLRTVTQIFENVFRQPSFGVGLVATALILAGLTGLLGARLGSISNANQALRNEIEANKNAKVELEQEVVTLNQELDVANGFVTTYENQLTEVLQQNQQLQLLADTAQLNRDEVATQVAGLLSNNEGLLSRNSALEERIAAQNEILDLFTAADSEAINIGGTAKSPESSATIVFNPNSDVAILLVNDLPQLEGEEVYQVLLIRGTEHDTAETFSVNAEGKNILVIQSPSPLSVFDTVGVSVEPPGGSAQRTGDVVLVGEIVSN